MTKATSHIIPGVLLLLLAGLLYGPYIHNPIFFDDIYFFINPAGYVHGLQAWEPFARRWISNDAMALTWKFWGKAYEPYHITSLLLHGLVACSLYVWVRDLLTRRGVDNEQRPALIAAALFALHPVAAFAAGAIIQRSMLLATLFSLWMWIAVGRGVARRQGYWLVLSVLFYYAAVFSKEHAVTAIGVAVLVAWDAADGDWRRTARSIALPLTGWIAIAISIALVMHGVIGSNYEPIAAEMISPEDNMNSPSFLARSMFNQAYLWFRYVLLWLLPNENWMAVDLRVPYPPTVFAMPWIFGVAAYATYPICVGLLYRAQKISRLAAIALWSPWLLFFAQFSAVQYQESFVLYRSYLWAVPGAILVALGLARLTVKAQWLALAVAGTFLFSLSWSRLQTFSLPILIWDEAVQRLEGRDDLPGAYRVYHDRGLEYTRMGFMDRALNDFNKAISLNPSYPYVYNDRGYVYYKQLRNQLALEDFQRVIDVKPDYPRAYVGKGLTLLAMGRRSEGLGALKQACDLGFACSQYQAALISPK